jgi:hypothetical protein
MAMERLVFKVLLLPGDQIQLAIRFYLYLLETLDTLAL